jgi:hypothetical protein
MIQITYVGFNDSLEERLIEYAKDSGWKFLHSGFSVDSSKRELCYAGHIEDWEIEELEDVGQQFDLKVKRK